MESWLFTNLEFWSNPTSYFKASQLFSPGLLSPQGANILLILFVFLPVRFGWSAVSSDIRWAVVITASIVFPLFIASCHTDEIRNLSMLFPLIFVVDVQGIHAMFRTKIPSMPASSSI